MSKDNKPKQKDKNSQNGTNTTQFQIQNTLAFIKDFLHIECKPLSPEMRKLIEINKVIHKRSTNDEDIVQGFNNKIQRNENVYSIRKKELLDTAEKGVELQALLGLKMSIIEEVHTKDSCNFSKVFTPEMNKIVEQEDKFEALNSKRSPRKITDKEFCKAIDGLVEYNLNILKNSDENIPNIENNYIMLKLLSESGILENCNVTELKNTKDHEIAYDS